MDDQNAHYMPSLAEIAAACEKIRAGWPAGEHRRRQGGDDPRRAKLAAPPEGWTPPVIAVTPEVAAAMEVM